MPAYGYEFYLLVFNSISRVDHWKIKFISTRGHVISSIRCTELCSETTHVIYMVYVFYDPLRSMFL